MKARTYKIVSAGGIGDAILTTPVFKAIKTKDPDCKVKVYCRTPIHREIYRHNPYIDSLTTLSFWEVPLASTLYYINPNAFYNNGYGNLFPSKIYQVHASKIIAEMMETQVGDEDMQIYLTKEEEEAAAKAMAKYKNPVIIHITSTTSANQHWPIEYWKKLISIMPDHTFIQLGVTNERKIEGAIDLRGKTSVREAIALLKYSKSFVGVVSSLAHATNAVGVPGVVLFGPSTPVLWGYRNNINLYKKIPCAPCIDVLYDARCPYGKLCMKSITPEEVKEAVLKQTVEQVVKSDRKHQAVTASSV